MWTTLKVFIELVTILLTLCSGLSDGRRGIFALQAGIGRGPLHWKVKS